MQLEPENCVKNKMFLYLFLTLVVLASGSQLSTDRSLLISALLVASSGIIFIMSGKTTLSIYTILVPGIFFSFLMVQSRFVEGTNFDVAIKLTVLMLCVFIGINVIKSSAIDYLSVLANIIKFFMYLSFVVYVLILLGVNLPQVYISELDYYSTLYLGVENIADGLAGSGITLPRSFGIFCEPGLYQIFLNYLIIFILFIKKKRSKKDLLQLIFIVINIVLTFSIIGYVVAVCLIFLFIFLRQNKLMSKILLIMLYIIVIAFVFPIISDFLRFKMTTGSFETRTADITLGLDVLFDNFWFGTGLDQIAYRKAYEDVYQRFRGNTNGLLSIGIIYGVFGIIFYYVGIKKFLKEIKAIYGVVAAIAMLGWLIASLINEPIQNSCLLYAFMALGWIKLKEVKNRKAVCQQISKQK
ncbi:MAG: O-antigen ligase family protein [Clostridiales bacterium]|nr:O-antigen ligase family protein [Clostridiales bacterium]